MICIIKSLTDPIHVYEALFVIDNSLGDRTFMYKLDGHDVFQRSLNNPTNTEEAFIHWFSYPYYIRETYKCNIDRFYELVELAAKHGFKHKIEVLP